MRNFPGDKGGGEPHETERHTYTFGMKEEWYHNAFNRPRGGEEIKNLGRMCSDIRGDT